MKLKNYYVRNGRYQPYKNLKAKECANIKIYNGLNSVFFDDTKNTYQLKEEDLNNLRSFINTCTFGLNSTDIVIIKIFNENYFVNFPMWSSNLKDIISLVLSGGSFMNLKAFFPGITTFDVNRLKYSPIFITIDNTGLITRWSFDDFYKSYQSE